MCAYRYTYISVTCLFFRSDVGYIVCLCMWDVDAQEAARYLFRSCPAYAVVRARVHQYIQCVYVYNTTYINIYQLEVVFLDQLC